MIFLKVNQDDYVHDARFAAHGDDSSCCEEFDSYIRQQGHHEHQDQDRILCVARITHEVRPTPWRPSFTCVQALPSKHVMVLMDISGKVGQPKNIGGDP